MFLKKVKLLISTLLIVFFITACGELSTEDLAVEVQKSMEEKFDSLGINIDSLMLVKKGGNVYSGVVETTEPNGKFTYTVEVVYDGETFTWETK